MTLSGPYEGKQKTPHQSAQGKSLSRNRQQLRRIRLALARRARQPESSPQALDAPAQDRQLGIAVEQRFEGHAVELGERFPFRASKIRFRASDSTESPTKNRRD